MKQLVTRLPACLFVAFVFAGSATPALAGPSGGSSAAALATLALIGGQHEAAAVLAYEAIRQEPQSARPYLLLGLARDQMGDHAGAVAAYRVVVRFEGRDLRAMRLLARALRRSGDIDGAMRIDARARVLAQAAPSALRTAAR